MLSILLRNTLFRNYPAEAQATLTKLYGDRAFFYGKKSTYFSKKLYFFLETRRGNALKIRDFKKIKRKDEVLYDFISTGKCAGFCYSICYDILKTLRKGKIKYIAIKNVLPSLEDRNYPYTMHVIYVNENWAFDTFCQRQFKLKELLEIYEAKEYKEFSFSDISDKTYEEFAKEQALALRKWCKKNNVYQMFDA